MPTKPPLADKEVRRNAGPRPGATCPICGGTTFKPHKRRGPIRCATCRSLPRARVAWLLVERVVRLRPDARIAHFAPEPMIARLLTEKHGAGYEAYALDPTRPRWAEEFFAVRRFDLCADLPTLEDGASDLVMHHHVMEHLLCNETIVLQRLQAKVRPGGHHVFSFPILRGGHYRSDIDPNLTEDDRSARFGQFNHARRWGERTSSAPSAWCSTSP